jgi:hypothetical protein
LQTIPGVSVQKLADGRVVGYEYLFNREHDIVETHGHDAGRYAAKFVFQGWEAGKKTKTMIAVGRLSAD